MLVIVVNDFVQLHGFNMLVIVVNDFVQLLVDVNSHCMAVHVIVD